MIKLVEFGWGQSNPAFLQMFTSQFFPQATLAQAHSFNEIQRHAASPRVAARLIRAFAELDASAELARVQAPTLVFHSRGDNRVPFEEGRFIATSIRGARFEPLDSNSHVPLPGEPAFQRLIDDMAAFVPPSAAAVAVCRADAARTRSARPGRPRSRQRADRCAVGPFRKDGAQLHHRHLRQDGGRRTARRRSWLRASPVWAAPPRQPGPTSPSRPVVWSRGGQSGTPASGQTAGSSGLLFLPARHRASAAAPPGTSRSSSCLSST